MSTALAGFRGGAVDTAGPSELSLRPGQGIILGVTLTRRWGAWAAAIGASYLPTHVEAVTSELAVQDRTTDLARVRFAVTAARQIAAIGGGRLEVRAGPTLDNWSAEGEDGRTVAGAEAAVALQLPAGPVVLEQVLGFGWSAGPFRTAELPAGYYRQRLRAMSIGLGIVLGL